MKKQEVLSLLERFPDLVDSDELIQDLFTEAVETPASGSSSDAERKARGERSSAIRSSPTDESSDPFRTSRC